MRRSFLSSVVVKSVDEARVRKAMDDYAKSLLATRAEIEEIVVFGSFLRGDFAPGSDLDVFLLLTHSERAYATAFPTTCLAPFRFRSTCFRSRERT